MKSFSKFKLKSLLKNRRRNREWLSMERSKMLWNISRKQRKKRDLDLSNLTNKDWLTSKLENWWRSVINKKKFWTNRLLKLRTKLLPYSKRRNDVRLKWNLQSLRVDKTNSTEKIEKLTRKSKRSLSSQNSGKWETKSWLLLNNKKRRRRDKEKKKWPIIWEDR